MGINEPESLTVLRQHRLNELQELKSQGTRLIGYFCLYVPVEIVRAAGAVPVRLARADYPSSAAGEQLLRVDACPFCKSSLGLFNSDPLYQQLDGVIFVNTCDMMRRLPELVATRVRIPVFQLYLPRTSEPVPSRIAEFTRQLNRLTEFLSHLTGTTPDRERLLAAISTENQLRSKLRALEMLRAVPGSGLKTSRFFDLIALATLLAPEQTLTLISEIINPPTPPAVDECQPRLLLAGSIVAESDRDLLNLIEERAAIVADVICTGARLVEGGVATTAEPLTALARYYFGRIPCACRRPNDRLYQHIQQLIEQRRVQGIVYQTLLYCDPWRFEARDLRRWTGLPMLEIDHDYSRQNYEQLRTRIEAFVEMLCSLKR